MADDSSESANFNLRRRKTDGANARPSADSNEDTVNGNDCGTVGETKVIASLPMKQMFGFELADFKSWSSVVRLFNRPVDGSSLAVFRVMFGEYSEFGLIRMAFGDFVGFCNRI